MSAGGRSSLTGPAADTRSGPGRRHRGGSAPARQPPLATRSRRANSSSARRHSPAARWAWPTIHGIHAAGVLDGDRGAGRPVVEDDPRRVAIVGHPIGLERDQRVHDDRPREQPVGPGRVEPVDDVIEPDRAASLEAGHEVDDAHGRERIAGLGDRRGLDPRVGKAGRGGTPVVRPGLGGRRGRHRISERKSRDWKASTAVRVSGSPSGPRQAPARWSGRARGSMLRSSPARYRQPRGVDR